MNAGNLTAAAGANVTLAGSGTANLTLTGPVADVNQALQSLVYQAGSQNGTNQLAMATSNANGTLDADAFFIQVQGLSNAPPANSVPGNQTLTTDYALQLCATNGNAIQISDIDAGAGDISVALSVDLGTLAYAINYGVVATGYGTQNLLFTGTLEKVNATLDTLFYQPATAGNATLTVTTIDNGNTGSGGSQGDIDTFNLLIQPPASQVNVAAMVHVPAAQQFVVVGVPLAFNAAGHNAITVSDADAGYYEVEVTLAALHGILGLGTTVGLTFVNGTSNDSANLAIRGRADHINYNLKSLTYLSQASYTGADTITVAINDLGNSGTGGATFDIQTIQLASAPLAVNHPPVLSVPMNQTVVADEALLFSEANGNAITLADPDAAAGEVEVHLQVDAGTLAIAIAYDVVYTGYGTSNLTLTGTIENINQSLGTLFYQSGSATGDATLTITANDRGNLGADGPKTDTETVRINVQSLETHANAAPRITAPVVTQTASVNGTLAFMVASSNAITCGDLDAGYDEVQVTFTVEQGTLEATPLGTGGPTVAGNGTSTLSLLGRVDHINYILQSLRYKPALGYSGADALDILIDDLGRHGVGGAKTANASVDILVG